MQEFFVDHQGFVSFFKDKDSILWYAVDWSKIISGSTILTSTWTADGITILDSSNTTTTASVKVSAFGGVASARNEVTLNNGETMQRTLRFYEVES